MDVIEVIIYNDIHFKNYIYENYSKSFYGYLKSTKTLIYVNNKEVDINVNLKRNDILKIEYFNKEKNTIKVDKQIDIIYEDEYILVVDKEANLLTIPSINQIDSVYSRLINIRNDSINIITRLDKLTSGLILVSKKAYLVDTINNNIILKEYIAKTNDFLPDEKGIIDLPIKKSDTIKRIVDNRGKNAITKYEIIDKDNKIYKLQLLTGRTHQIRVHLSYYNCPIIGDSLYGGSDDKILNLICKKIKLIHPITNKEIEIDSKYELR